MLEQVVAPVLDGVVHAAETVFHPKVVEFGVLAGLGYFGYDKLHE